MTKSPSRPRSLGSPILLVAALLALSGCTAIPTSLSPTAVPLQYTTMANAGEFPTMPSCAAISTVTVSDLRMTPIIGKRYVETNPSISAPITAASDVRAWVKAGAGQLAQRVGIRQEPSGPILRLTVRQIAISEDVARRSGYEARLQLTAELARKGGGPCWQGQIEGSSQNYGYSGTAENYQETLNHALDRAMIRLLSDPGFQHNVCSCRR